MRQKTILLAGVALSFVPAFVLNAALAEDKKDKAPAPVIYASDPGEAHPKYDATEVAVVKAQPAPQTRVIKSGQGYAVTDNGGFDYGYASNEVELLVAQNTTQSATAAPTTLVAAVAPQPVMAQAAQNTSGPYQQDPIYRITDEQKPAPQPVAEVYAPETLPVGFVRVQQGDTVYGLARKFNIKPAAIIAANNLIPPYELTIDQMIRIPEKVTADSIRTVRTAPVTQPPARVQQVQYQAPTPAPTRIYVVEPGNTMYSISRMFGTDIKTLSELNNIPAPYTLSIGQQLILPANANMQMAQPAPAISDGQSWSQSTAQQAPQQAPGNRNTYVDPQRAAAPAPAPTQPYQRQAVTDLANAPTTISFTKPTTEGVLGRSRFEWPLHGKIVMNYGLDNNGRRNDGINIAAPVGTPIRAVDDGEIVYRGSDLEGYGNLLLIKHSNGWVSAYAHTDSMLVRKGEQVRKGQVIAKVGTTGSVAQPQLHFELRHDLKPADPIAALQGRDPKAIQ